MKKTTVCIALASALAIVSGCRKNSPAKERQVVIYSNADDEAVVAIKKTLDENGFKDKYILQSFGTSELGGKLLAEGTDIEADLVTMSSFYLESAQNTNNMFKNLDFSADCIVPHPSYALPMLAIQGAIIVNTKILANENLPYPKSIKDMGNPVYKDNISVVDPLGSTTAWLMIQALIESYGEDGAKIALKEIYKNAGPHLELSGSGPIKKVRAGEVGIGFGLRHQAVRDKKSGIPIDFIDPTEGNYSLTESVAVVNKTKKYNPLAMQMAETIISRGRTHIIAYYPVVLYEGETVSSEDYASNSRMYDAPLTTQLLKEHISLSEACK